MTKSPVALTKGQVALTKGQVALTKSQVALTKSLPDMAAKGGPRHTPKPLVDAMARNDSIIRNLGAYNTTSKSQSVSPKGIMHCYSLLQDLVELSSSAEIHTQPLGQALLKCVQEDPSLNDTQWNCGVWANIKCERLGTLLCHLRKLKKQDDLSSCAARLTSAEFVLIKKLLDSVENKSQAGKEQDLDKRNEQNLGKRKLKKELSEVSMDSKGYPACLKSPNQRLLAIEDEKPLPKGLAKPKEPSFLRRKIGQQTACQKQEVERGEGELKEAMGIKEAKGKKKKICNNKSKKKSAKEPVALKKKAALALTKKPAAHIGPCPKGPSSSKRAWQKLRITNAHKPVPRTYITGTYERSGKCSLIVEVSSKRSPEHRQVANHILRKLQKEHLTKQQALALRDELC